MTSSKRASRSVSECPCLNASASARSTCRRCHPGVAAGSQGHPGKASTSTSSACPALRLARRGLRTFDRFANTGRHSGTAPGGEQCGSLMGGFRVGDRLQDAITPSTCQTPAAGVVGRRQLVADRVITLRPPGLPAAPAVSFRAFAGARIAALVVTNRETPAPGLAGPLSAGNGRGDAPLHNCIPRQAARVLGRPAFPLASAIPCSRD
jgi:hypothetical protein